MSLVNVIPERIKDAMKAISDGMSWTATPQGFAYWNMVYDNLWKLIDQEGRCPTCGQKRPTEDRTP